MKEHTGFRLTNSLASEIEAAYREADNTFVMVDLGCGKGLYHEDIKETLSGLGDKEVEILGLDVNREALEYTQDNQTAVADVIEYGIPVRDDSVDFVYSNHLRCQIEEKELREIEDDAERVLKDTGRQYHRC